MRQITVVGGGLAGLTAAIACVEGGAKVRLLEGHATLGGRARSEDGPYKANLGPHAGHARRGGWLVALSSWDQPSTTIDAADVLSNAISRLSTWFPGP